MTPNPALGVVFHWLGGLASGSFYVPYRKVKQWSWETYWLAGGIFSWIVAPWVIGGLMTNSLVATVREAPGSTLFWVYFFGVLWGFGGLTFGLTMRYLGMSLGMAVVLGFCAAFGTLMPPIFAGEFVTKVLGTHSGLVILLGVGVCLAGITIAGMAGVSKEHEMSPEQKTEVIKEFAFKRGVAVAVFSGVMSACFSYGLAAGQPIRDLTIRHGTPALWQGLPILVVLLLGGFTTNFVWCVILHVKNRTGYQYFRSALGDHSTDANAGLFLENATDAPGEEMVKTLVQQAPARTESPARAPMLSNYLFCALAGTTWYFQFFFYTMGETQMGAYKFSSWTLHMASIIIFSSLWGIGLHEWRGASRRTKGLLALSIAVLVASTVIVGYGNYLAAAPPA
ncbi:MAG: L-rhamnose/proton symporter RhaT [Acidobacteriia bacterium]|nr:L-rhamnose/proton symporter RhaT [Terriglobia bacterium]